MNVRNCRKISLVETYAPEKRKILTRALLALKQNFPEIINNVLFVVFLLFDGTETDEHYSDCLFRELPETCIFNDLAILATFP